MRRLQCHRILIILFTMGIVLGLALDEWFLPVQLPPADYRFQQGAYTLCCRDEAVFPRDTGTFYSFTLYKNRRQVGQPLFYEWDSTDVLGFAQWWGTGVVTGRVDGTDAAVDVGNCRLQLDFAAQRLETVRVYGEELPRELLAVSADGKRAVYRFDISSADSGFNLGGQLLLEDEIVLLNTQSGEYHYLCSATGCNKVLFDRRNNLFCCSWWGVYRYTADSGKEKPLPFDFPYNTEDEFVFVDFAYDTAHEVYLMAWAERQGDASAMQLSLYGPEGGLLANCDTGCPVPACKVGSLEWPRLSLDGEGVKLCGSEAEGGVLPYFTLPAEAYLQFVR